MRAIFAGTRYANVTSTHAPIVALGGTGAYAASKITSADIGHQQGLVGGHRALRSPRTVRHTPTRAG